MLNRVRSVRKMFKATPTSLNHAHFRPVLARKYSPYQPTELFSIVSQLKHAKVSQSNSLFSSLAREEVPFGPSSVLALLSPKGGGFHGTHGTIARSATISYIIKA